MENFIYLEVLIYGCYALVLFTAYALIGFSIYLNRSTEVKLLSVSLDPKRAFKSRNEIKEKIQIAEKEMKLAMLWPVFLIQRFLSDDKKKIKKETK